MLTENQLKKRIAKKYLYCTKFINYLDKTCLSLVFLV